MEDLPLETLYDIAEHQLSLKDLIQWTQVSRKLATAAWKFLNREKFWAKSLAFDADHARLGIAKVQSDELEKPKYTAPQAVVDFVKRMY